MRWWSLLSIPDQRQHGGNLGYADDPLSVYRYDSDVANWRRLAPGDHVILRNRTRVLGTAVVEDIEKRQGMKVRLRCPVCRITSVKPRTKKLPPWRCKSGHIFAAPIESEEPVTLLEAHYGASFVRVGFDISASTLKAAALRPSDQTSIEEIDPSRFSPDLQIALSAVPLQRSNERLGPYDALDDGADYSPEHDDERRKVMRSIAVRRGQRQFREKLIARDNSRCLVTGCEILDLLEAAHISPYRGERDNHIENGLLLRSDIHTLFDLDLLGIEPETLTLHLSFTIQDDSYRHLEGQILRPTSPLSRAALQQRWLAFCSLRYRNA